MNEIVSSQALQVRYVAQILVAECQTTSVDSSSERSRQRATRLRRVWLTWWLRIAAGVMLRHSIWSGGVRSTTAATTTNSSHLRHTTYLRLYRYYPGIDTQCYLAYGSLYLSSGQPCVYNVSISASEVTTGYEGLVVRSVMSLFAWHQLAVVYQNIDATVLHYMWLWGTLARLWF